jgi:hypothetical protein
VWPEHVEGLGHPKPQTLVLSAIQDDGYLNPGAGFGVVGWTCGNCGFVRLHSLDFLEAEPT